MLGNEIFDGIVREELAEFRAELCRERLIVGEHERRPVQPCDHVCHRERFARARNAEQRLHPHTRFNPGDERVDRLGLVARGGVI